MSMESKQETESTSPAGAASPSTEDSSNKDDEVPISGRRAKAMSVGNAASLFGASDDDVAALFGGGADTPSKPASMAQSPFDAIGEESEEAAAQPAVQQQVSVPAAGSAANDVPESPSDTAAALFGDGGQTPVEWLGGASGSSATASSSDDASNLFASVPQQQQAQDPSLYASGQFGDAQYGYDYSTTGQEAYNYQQDPQQYAQYALSGQQQQQYAQYAPQAPQQQVQPYTQYEEAAPDNFNQSMYYDPTQQQQYQQTLQAQAHLQQAPVGVNGQPSQVAYDQQQYSQYASPAAGQQDQYAAYYAQQPYPAQQQQPVSAYQSQGYLPAQQSYQTSYSAPAGPAQGSQLSQSQASQAGAKSQYAPTYSETYDPYAPSSDPYRAQQIYRQPPPAHSKQPSLSSSKTTPNLAAPIQSTSAQQPGKKDPKLNRSASSFFAELPPMPVKSRPASAVGARAAASPVPPVPALPGVHQQAMPPPPPKSKSPAPLSGYGQQRPPSRVKSTQPAPDYGGWSPSMSGSTHSRPGSRTEQRQGSIASTSSYPSQPETSRTSYSQGQQQASQAYGQYGENNTAGSGSHGDHNAYQTTPAGVHSQQGMTSPAMSSRQSLDSNRSYQGHQAHVQPHSSQSFGTSQSRPQSRSSQPAHPSPAGSASVLPPARRVASRNTSTQQHSAPIPAAATGAPISNQLGLTNDNDMGDLANTFAKQNIGREEQSASPATAETSLSRAIKTPLPASEPDTEPRVFSPQQSQWTDLPHAPSKTGQAGASLSPRPPSVPLLSVSLPSPEVDKKPSLSPLDEDMTSADSQTYASETPSDVRDAEEELRMAEQEIKMEEDDFDQKPSHATLARTEGLSEGYTSSLTYGSSPYEAEESKPSPEDLQQAWKTEDPNDPYAQGAQHTQQQDAAYSGWQQDSYGQPQAQGHYENTQYSQQSANAQYDAYHSYEAQQQQSGPGAAQEFLYRAPPAEQETFGTAKEGAPYEFSTHDSNYAQNSYEQPSTTSYEPYQSNTAAGSHLYPSSSQQHQQRLQNRPPVPIASFGFNGKLVTFFPSSSTAAASYGMYEQPGGSGSIIKIQKLADILPTDSSGLDSFPGPLFMDTGSTSASGKTKKKKELVTWLTARIEESQQERNYLGAGANEEAKAKAEQKTMSLQLVKTLLEHDGKLTGTPQIDRLVQQILVPRLAASEQSTASFAVAADLGKRASDVSSVASSQATEGDLDTLQMHLLKGEKREAVQYALNNRLYTHALVIASGTDKSLMAEVVKDFLAFELGGNAAGGREPLKVAYSLLAGSGPACIHEFVSPKQSLPNGHGPIASPAGQGADLYAPSISRAPTPNARPEFPSNVPPHTLAKWQETAAMIIANRSPGESQALTSLGEVLAANAWYKAAHACYLLSPLTSTLGGPSVPGVRWTLFGASDPLQDPLSSNDLEAIVMTEIIEFAFSLVPVPKGQEAYIGLPHLQAYRVLHARQLADSGHHSKAQKYCDAIGATLKLATKRSPFYHPTLLAQVKDLSDRLSMVSFQDKTGSWISRKVQRPTIDNVWSTLESRFAKFVTGDGEEDPAEEERKRKARDAAKGVAGPFAHYSSITPQGPEGLSRNGSYADLTMRTTPPPQPTSVPNTVSNASTTKATHHRRSSSYTYGPYGADPYGNYVPQMAQTAEEPEEANQQPGYEQQTNQSQGGGHNEPQYGYVTPQNDSGWWSTGNGGQESSPYGSSSSYGQAPTFSPVTEGFGSSDAQGLMSPMGFSQSPNMTSQNFQPQPSKLQQEVAPAMMEEEDDELGLGNSSARRKRETASASGKAENTSAETDKKAEAPKKEEAGKQTAPASGSWLGRIFRREGSASPTTGPIRAKLGEETSFVYDPVEKRWVNKKSGSDTPPPAATPPPPRAQTASPAGFSPAASTAKSGTPPPPFARSVSATPMQPSAPPARSTPPPPAGNSASLPAPPPGPSSLGSRPPSRAASVPSGELPPPPARKPGGGSAAAKKARSRYVDVLAQEQK